MANTTMAQIPRINPLYRLQWEPAQNGHVLLYPEGMVQLNGPASEILTRIDGQTDVAQIIASLQQTFPEAEGLADDVISFLEDAREQNWITL